MQQINAPLFGIKVTVGKTILREVLAAVSDWRKIARQLRFKVSILNAYASAFKHSMMDEARRLA